VLSQADICNSGAMLAFRASLVSFIVVSGKEKMDEKKHLDLSDSASNQVPVAKTENSHGLRTTCPGFS